MFRSLRGKEIVFFLAILLFLWFPLLPRLHPGVSAPPPLLRTHGVPMKWSIFRKDLRKPKHHSVRYFFVFGTPLESFLLERRWMSKELLSDLSFFSTDGPVLPFFCIPSSRLVSSQERALVNKIRLPPNPGPNDVFPPLSTRTQ